MQGPGRRSTASLLCVAWMIAFGLVGLVGASEPPIVVGTPSVLPDSVDVAAGTAVVQVRVGLRDPDSDFLLVQFVFVRADSAELAFGAFALPIEGTPREGTWGADVPVPLSADGLYTLTIISFDSAAELSSLSTAATLRVTGGDIVLPALGGAVTLAPTTVNLAAGDAEVTVTIPLTDAGSGVAQVSAEFLDPDESSVAWGLADILSGDLHEGIWRATVTIPSNTPEGSYGLRVRASDLAANDAVLPTGLTLRVGGGDTVPPVLAGPASVDPDTLELDAGPRSVTVQATLGDPASGLQRVWAEFRASGATAFSGDTLALVSGDNQLGVWTGSLAVPLDALPGLLELVLIASDVAGNEATLPTGALLLVRRVDSTPPTLVGEASIAPDTLNASRGPRSTTIEFVLADDRSGVALALADLRATEGGDLLTAVASRISGDSLEGRWQARIDVAPDAAPQSFGLRLDVRDHAGNRALIDTGKTLRVVRDTETPVTFNLDARSLMRPGFFRPDRGMALHIDIFEAVNPALVTMTDTDGDSIYSATIPLFTDSPVRYAYAFDAGFTQRDRWFDELGGRTGGRRVTPSSTAPLILAPVHFDDRPPSTAPRHPAARGVRSLWGGSSGDLRFEEEPNVHVTLRVPELQGGRVIAARRYRGPAGGSLPAGIVVASSAIHWELASYPSPVPAAAVLGTPYDLNGGVEDPASLRWLRRDSAGAPWEIVTTSVNATSRTLEASVANLDGEWTLGSTSPENSLQPTPPDAASDPNPPHGSYVDAGLRELVWSRTVGAMEYDVYLWDEGAPRPAQPSSIRLAEPVFTVSTPFVALSAHLWQVVARNAVGTTPGPVWSFRVDRVADLDVMDMAAPDAAFGGQAVEVEWTIHNGGLEATNAAQWFDRVIFSVDRDLDFRGDRVLGSFPNVAYLAPGESYRNRREVVIPPDLPGDGYLFVQTNGDGRLVEGSTSNNLRVRPIHVEPARRPDLDVVSLSAPARAFSGQPVTVAWSVRNLGPATLVDRRPPDNSLADGLYLSADTLLDAFGDYFLGSAPAPVTLAPDSSYAWSIRFPLPDSLFGDFHLILVSDLRNAFPETEEIVNNRRTRPLTITLTPPPDLVVSEIEAPAGAASGKPITLAWRTENFGPGPVPSRSWSTRALLVDESGEAAPLLLGTWTRTGPAAADSAWEVTERVLIPNGLSGRFRLRVIVDWDDRLFEYSGENNNTSHSDPFDVTLSPGPDLAPVSLEVAREAGAGDPLELRWRVSNAGADTARGHWIDRVFLTTTASWDSASALLVGAAESRVDLPPGASYSAFALGRLPARTTGAGYLHLVADADARLYEHMARGNNVLAAVPITLHPPAVDLRIDEVTAPPSAESGRPVTLGWSVENSGSARTRAPAWSDRIYLSTDTQLDRADDLLLEEYRRDAPLDGGATYRRSVEVRLPRGLSGPFHILVETDAAGEIPEGDVTNNVSASTEVMEIMQPPAPDLRVEGIVAAATASAGQPFPVSFVLRNAGVGPTREPAWYQGLYISKYPVVDPRARPMGSHVHTSNLAAGAATGETVQLDIPAWLAGTWYLLVQADARDDVDETGAESNNTALAVITFNLPPPTDLIVSAVTIESEAIAGDSVTVRWTLENLGSHPARGRMTDAVYLSTDSTWTVDDPLVALLDRTIDLAGGSRVQIESRVSLAAPLAADAEGNVRQPLPGLLPGAYRALVRTNIRATIRETDQANNLGISDGPLMLGIPLLPFDTPTSATLVQDGSIHYRIEVPGGGETVSIMLEGAGAGVSHELYLRYGEPPSRSRFDASGRIPFNSDQEVLIPAASAGSWYVMAFGDRVPPGEGAITLTARVRSFEIDGLSPESGGQGGLVTLKLSGTAIEPQVRPTLVHGALRLDPVRIKWVDPTTVFATWNLAGAPLGVYDFVAEQIRVRYDFTGDALEPVIVVSDTNRVGLPAAFTVEPPRSLPTDIRISYPKVVRVQQHFEFAIEATNLANNDVRAPLVYVIGAPDFAKGPAGNLLPGGRLFLLAATEGPAGLLRPGVTTRLEIEGVAPIQPGFTNIHVLPAEERSSRFDLDHELEETGVEPGSPIWSEAVERLRSRDLSSWADYADLLAASATAIPGRVAVPRDAESLLLRALRAEAEEILHPSAPTLRVPPTLSAPGPSGQASTLEPYGVAGPPDCSQTRIELDQAALTATAAGFILVNGYAAANHLARFVGGGGDVSYDADSDVADMARRTTEANRSVDMVHDRVAQQIHEQIRSHLEANGCRADAPPAFNLVVEPPDFYPVGRPGAVTVIDPSHRDLILAFGGMRRARAVIKKLDITARRTSACSHECDEYVCHAGYSGVVEYHFEDDYEYSREDCGSSTIERAACNLQKCGKAHPFKTEIVIEKTVAGSIVLKDGGSMAAAIGISEAAAPASACDPGERERDPSPVQVVTSLDPNDILGPAGVGDDRWVARTESLPYTVRFENDPTRASAPAQVVTVTQKLDADLDLRTFRLGRYGFGSFVFSPPAGAAYLTERLDVRDSLGIFVDITAGIDVTSGEAFWIFKSIDPAGGDLPADPLTGFLPVDDAAGRGDGFVSYTVRARPDTRTGDVVTAQAAIVFDQNPPLDTPTIRNSIDADAPRSRIRAVSGPFELPRIALEWDGTDSTGAGVGTYRLFGSRDDEPFTLLKPGLEEPRLTVDGEFGHTYRFYVQAIDRTGNVEAARTSADVTVRLDSTGVSVPPTAFALHANAPNPFKSTTAIVFDAPGTGRVTLRLFDVAGRLIRYVAPAPVGAGRHQFPLDLTGRTGGLYFVQMHYRGDDGQEARATRKIVLAR